MQTAHRIRRLRWHVRAGSRDAAFEVRARLRELHKGDLLDVLGRAFDAAGAGDTIVHLPRLELAVTVADIDAVGAALAQAFKGENVLDAAARQTAPRIEFGDGEAPTSTEPEAVGGDGLVAYLRTGVLPWPLANLGRTTTRDELIGLAFAHRGRVAANVPPALDAAIAYVFRWLQLTPAADWTAIARLVGGEMPASELVQPVSALASIYTASSPRLPGTSPEAVAAAVLAVTHLDRSAARITPRQLSSLFAPVVEMAGEPPHRTLKQPKLAPVAAWIAARLADVAEHSPTSTPAIVAAASASSTFAESRRETPLSNAIELRRRQTDDDGPGLIVDHAGLVVLHPFLPLLFDRLSVAPRGGGMLGPALLPRAAALLAYAAVGDDSPLDFELGLVKVLLGLRPDSIVLTPAGTLTAADCDEVDALLSSVIEHWKVLKHTSIAGLRASFLQRRALLAWIDGSWRLRVEPDSFDMLIDHLPWALGPIKLPWMTTLLFTEWARS